MPSEMLFESFFDEAAEAIFLVSQDGRIGLANRTSEILFGYTREELLGRGIEELIPPRFREHHVGHRGRYTQDPQRRPMGTGLQLVAMRKDGTEFPVDITLSAHGTVGETLCVVRDVTERAQRDGFEKAILASTNCAIFVAGEGGLLHSWNEGAARMWGYAAGEVLRRLRLSDLFVDLESGEVQEGERDLTMLHRNGSPGPVRVSINRMSPGPGLPYATCCVAVDIREHVEVRRELGAAYEARTRFFARASHELRTPLNSILGFGQLLAEEGAGQFSPAAERYLERIRAGGERLLRLTNDLLELSRWEMGAHSLDIELFDARAFLDEILSDFLPTAAEKRVTLAWHAAEGLSISADRLRIGQVLTNLVANAIRFTQAAGRVDVTALTAPGGCAIEVADNGPGIPVETRRRIFEEFFQIQGAGRAKNTGSGLGLPIAKRLVEAHGGTLTLDSELGLGSRFRIYLRRAANS